MDTAFYPSQQFSQQPAMTVINTAFHPPQQFSQQPALAAMNTASQSSPKVWLMESGAINHMIVDLSNLQLITTYPTTNMV